MLQVLVVDDSKIARMGIIKSLKEIVPDATVLQATNGAEAVALYEQERPNVVFLDLTMPVMDGYEALGKIIAMDKEAQVIIVSADIQSEAKLRVLVAGAKNMYPKPINHEVMMQIFEKDIVL